MRTALLLANLFNPSLNTSQSISSNIERCAAGATIRCSSRFLHAYDNSSDLAMFCQTPNKIQVIRISYAFRTWEPYHTLLAHKRLASSYSLIPIFFLLFSRLAHAHDVYCADRSKPPTNPTSLKRFVTRKSSQTLLEGSGSQYPGCRRVDPHTLPKLLCKACLCRDSNRNLPKVNSLS